MFDLYEDGKNSLSVKYEETVQTYFQETASSQKTQAILYLQASDALDELDDDEVVLLDKESNKNKGSETTRKKERTNALMMEKTVLSRFVGLKVFFFFLDKSCFIVLL